MKKLNKTQKENLKKNIFKVFHVLGYISIGLVALFSIVVGVKGCNSTNQVQVYDNLTLRQSKQYNVINENNISYSTLLNNYGDMVEIKSGDVFISNGFLGYSLSNLNTGSIDFYALNSSNQYVIANVGVYRFRFDNDFNVIESTYFILQDIYIENGLVYGHDEDNDPRLLGGNSSLYVTVFEDNRYLFDYQYSPLIFNGYLIQSDKYAYSQSHGSEYTDYVKGNISSYISFANKYWVKPNKYYLAPFVLPIDDLVSNSRNSSYIPLNMSIGEDIYQYLRYDYGSVLYNYDRSEDYSSAFFNFIDTLEKTGTQSSQVLGYSTLGLSNQIYFKNNVGMYKFHNTYKNFLNYCFELESTLTHAQYEEYSVYTDLSISANLFDIYRMDNIQINTTYWYFDNAVIRNNGIVYSSYGFKYENIGWVTYYSWNNSIGDSTVSLGLRDPLFNGNIYKANYYKILRLLVYGYNPTTFTKLLGYYDPNFIYGEGAVSSGDSSINGLGDLFSIFTDAFKSVADVLSINLFGAFTLGSLLCLPLVVMIVLFIVNLFKR